MSELTFQDKPSITFNDEGSTTKLRTPRADRDGPSVDWEHRLKARDHVKYLQDNKLIDVGNAQVWGKKTFEGRDWYCHTFQDNTMLVSVRSATGIKLNHENNAALENFLRDNPGQNVIFDIYYIDNGTDYVSTCQMSALAVGLTSVGLVIAAVGFFTVAALGGFVIEGAVAALIAGVVGLELNVLIPGAGIILCVLAFIGIWLAYELGRNIEVNIMFENRSQQDLRIVDCFFYNIDEDHVPEASKAIYQAIKSPDGVPFRKLREVAPNPPLPPLDEYDVFEVQVVNYSKYKGIGLAFKFVDSSGNSMTIAIRNDIYKDGKYRMTDAGESAVACYYNADNDYDVVAYVPWVGGLSGGLWTFMTLDTNGFHNYNFAGIISFHENVMPYARSLSERVE